MSESPEPPLFTLIAHRVLGTAVVRQEHQDGNGYSRFNIMHFLELYDSGIVWVCSQSIETARLSGLFRHQAIDPTDVDLG